MTLDEVIQVKVLVAVTVGVFDLFGHFEEADVAEQFDDGAHRKVDVDRLGGHVARTGVLTSHQTGDKVRVRRQRANLSLCNTVAIIV